MGSALITDLYELNMAASYLHRGMVEPATFSLFVRRLPDSRGFLVAAGLEDCLAHLETFAFDDTELDWLAGAGFPQDTIEAFRTIRFTGDVRAVPEGRLVFADEPLLEVTAPIAEAQLVETYLLNQITFQTALATKAARCQLAAGDIELVDFALRRTHGVEAGLAVARVSAIAGFVGTSNVEAARRFELEAAGTMAHSYIEAFPSEIDAFRAFARDLPGRTTFLVDTYDTARGVDAAIQVIHELGLHDNLGVRLDSGDLVQLARQTRAQLDGAGLRNVRIFVSGGLDEYDLERFRALEAPIDAAGVGTRMGVSADAPYLDSAYKLVAFGARPVLKLSAGKATLPGAKQVWRRFPIESDVLASRQESAPAGYEPLLVPVMAEGSRHGPLDTIEAARRRLARDLGALPSAARDLHEPAAPEVVHSEHLRSLTATLTARLSAEASAGRPGQRPGLGASGRNNGRSRR
jgi:nicotinate phosphoribosyltransferase